jgi:hypothetical protein
MMFASGASLPILRDAFLRKAPQDEGVLFFSFPQSKQKQPHPEEGAYAPVAKDRPHAQHWGRGS